MIPWAILAAILLGYIELGAMVLRFRRPRARIIPRPRPLRIVLAGRRPPAPARRGVPARAAGRGALHAAPRPQRRHIARSAPRHVAA